jgi:dihydroorotate dehydrogenase (NAD+) catalytic subunit
VNASCPNLHADIWAHDARATGEVVRAVRGATTLPVLAKLSPNATDVVTIAHAAVDAGATALTLVNTMRAFLVDAGARRLVQVDDVDTSATLGEQGGDGAADAAAAARDDGLLVIQFKHAW